MSSEFWFVVQQDANVYAPDGVTPIGVVRPGRQYRALGESADWVTVEGPNGTTGFVAASAANKVLHATHEIGPGGARAWATPDGSRASIGQLAPGTLVAATETVSGWAYVRATGRFGGYIAARDLAPLS